MAIQYIPVIINCKTSTELVIPVAMQERFRKAISAFLDSKYVDYNVLDETVEGIEEVLRKIGGHTYLVDPAPLVRHCVATHPRARFADDISDDLIYALFRRAAFGG